MIESQLFPFEYVEKNSKVVIYGLGKYGISYMRQIQMTGWCEIVGLSDIDPEKSVVGIPFFNIQELSNLKVDYIVIAISAPRAAKQVYSQLVEYGIPEEKIINVLRQANEASAHILTVAPKVDNLQILIRAGGGLGDCIVYLSLCERIVQIDSRVEIDIQCNKVYGEVFFVGKRQIRSIIDNDEVVDSLRYDAVLMLEHGICVTEYNEDRCDRISPDLSEKLRAIIDVDLRSDIENNQYRYLVQVARARIKGWNRYQALGHGNLLKLSADMVHIDLRNEYLSEFNQLQLKKYITINRGAENVLKSKKIQTKVWPLRYYEQLIQLLKVHYPEYEIVQLGNYATMQISGVDRYIKGQNLELIKFILKNSTLHFDCEGGLVHLATAIGTKCAVVFGPTPLEYYGYPQNINITAGKCHSCMSLTKDWYVRCLKEQEEPECMYGIAPEIVLQRIGEYLDIVKTDYKISMEEVI